MQVVELIGVIFTLSIKVLIGISLAQLLKVTSREMTAWLSFYGFIAAGKLHCLIEPMYSGVLALIS